MTQAEVEVAPKGQVFVCIACRRSSKWRHIITFPESEQGWGIDCNCPSNAVLLPKNRLVYDVQGRVKELKGQVIL